MTTVIKIMKHHASKLDYVVVIISYSEWVDWGRTTAFCTIVCDVIIAIIRTTIMIMMIVLYYDYYHYCYHYYHYD